jgi:hypothetical protein
MRFGAKALITAALAGPAMAALILTVGGPANAAVTTTTAHTSSSSMPSYPYCNQYSGRYQPNGYQPNGYQPNQYQQNGYQQNGYQQGQWNLSGSNTAEVKFEVNTYGYPVYFRQQGSCLTGTLTDPGASFTGRIHGTVYGNFITFSVTYPSGDNQGTRTFNGTINQWGHVSGSWSETGSENAAGSWSLTGPAQHGCQNQFGWNNSNQGCYFYQP